MGKPVTPSAKKLFDFPRGAPLIIDYIILYQMIGDDKFWEDVPAFLFMKNAATVSYERIVADIVDSKKVADCFGCSSIKPIMVPLLITFAQHLAQLKETSPKALDDLRLYIAKLRGHVPTPITAYYVDEAGGKARVDI